MTEEILIQEDSLLNSKRREELETESTFRKYDITYQNVINSQPIEVSQFKIEPTT